MRRFGSASSAGVHRGGSLLRLVPRLVIALLVLLFAVPARAQAPVHVIPFELHDNRIWLAVSGPGFGPRPFILDTGAQSTHYTAELAAEARLRTAGRVGITGTGTERISGRYVAATVLRIGSLSLPVSRGIAAPADALFGPVYAGIGRRFDGVIGHDLFAAFVVEIDYEGRRLRLFDRRRGRPGAGAAIPIRLVDRKPYLAAEVSPGGATEIPANLHLDTGFGGAIGLNANFVARHRLIERVGPTLRGMARGVGGATEVRIARLPGVRIGEVAVAGPTATLASVQGRGVRSDSSGRIGGELLRRFTVTIDYRGRTLTLEPNAAFRSPFETDMSGLALTGGDGAVVVATVGEETPAGAAGIREGDRLTAVDGTPVAAMTLEAVRAALREDGAVRRLRFLRGGVEREVAITLRRRL